MLLEAKERYSVQDVCVIMLMSTIVVDKGNVYKVKKGAWRLFFLLYQDFLHGAARIRVHLEEVNTRCDIAHMQGI